MTLTRVHDHAAANWRSASTYRFGHGSSVNSTSRREAKTVRWLKRQARRAERRSAKADIAFRLADME